MISILDDLLRPKVGEVLYPSDKSESSILKMLMESCWSDSEEERPPFAYTLEILELITPLKGTPLSKRALLLERETESLERYISHDTQQIFNEQEKFRDLIHRMLPPFIATQLHSDPFSTGGENGGTDSVKPTLYNNVTVMVLKVHDLDHLVAVSNPNQLMDTISYLWKAIHVIIKSRNLKIGDMQNRGDTMMFGKCGLFLLFSYVIGQGKKKLLEENYVCI